MNNYPIPFYALVFFFLYGCQDSEESVRKEQEDVRDIIQVVTEDTALLAFLHLSDEKDSIIRIVPNGLFPTPGLSPANRKIIFSPGFNDKTSYIIFQDFTIKKNIAKVALEIPFEGVRYQATLIKNNSVWSVSQKELAEH